MIAQKTLEMLFFWCLIYGIPLAVLMAFIGYCSRQQAKDEFEEELKKETTIE